MENTFKISISTAILLKNIIESENAKAVDEDFDWHRGMEWAIDCMNDFINTMEKGKEWLENDNN